jgi:hypothetical protein
MRATLSLFFVALTAACAPSTPPAEGGPESGGQVEEHGEEDLELHDQGLIEERLFLTDTTREEALVRLHAAFQWSQENPGRVQDLVLESVARLTESHIIEVRGDGDVLHVMVYPADPEPAWEVMFTVDENNHVTNMVTATIEPPPELD